jgi:hypothetical protein
MKKILLILVVFTCLQNSNAQNVGIGTNTPAASAMLHINSTTKGLLMPRLTTVQRTAIASPATGLQVYDTNSNSFWYYNGSAWAEIRSGSSFWLSDGLGSIYNSNMGNLGIGTPAPLANSKLTLQTDADYNTAMTIKNPSGSASLQLYVGGPNTNNAVSLGTPGLMPLAFYTNGANRVFIGENGNVGIGTGTPLVNSKLTLQTDGDYSTAMTIQNPTGSSALQVYVGGPNTNNAASLGTPGAMPLAFYTNGVNRIFIGDEGSVGLLGSAASSFFNYGLNEATYIRAGKTGSTVFLNDSHNGNVDIANGGGRVNIQGSGLYAPSSGGLNIAPLGVVSVSFIFNPDFTNVTVENIEGLLATGTYTSSSTISADDYLVFNVDLNFTQLSGYSKVFAVGYPNFSGRNAIQGISQEIIKDATSAILKLNFSGDSFTGDFNSFSTSGTYIIYGVR